MTEITAAYNRTVEAILKTADDFGKITQGLRGKINIFCTEAFCTLTCVLPNSLKWCYKACFANQVTSYALKSTIDKASSTAYLYLHGRIDASNQAPALVLVHGDHGHPFTMLHLAEIAQKNGVGRVFSLYMPYDRGHSPVSQALFSQGIDKIERLIEESGGTFNGLIAAGHSKGAIQSAYRAFVENDERIKTVISIAGRLRLVPGVPCHEELKPTVEAVYRGIQDKPKIPLYQIVAENDWNAPLEATAVRPDAVHCTVVPGAMHLNVLYKPETLQKFAAILNA